MTNKKKTTPEKKELIHIKLNHHEFIRNKKNILNSEISTLEIAKRLKQYKKLRKEELKKKQQILKKIKEVKSDLTSLEKTLPKLKIPKILENSIPAKKEETKVDRIDKELERIQRKLRHLQGKY